MQTTLAPWTGDQFVMPSAQPSPTLPIGRTRRWSFSLGRDGLAISSTVEDHRPRVVAASGGPRPSLALTITGAVAGGFALLLLGASAGRAWAPLPTVTDATMVVPAAKPLLAATADVRPAPKRAIVGRAVPVVPVAATADIATTPAALARGDAIAKALRTGEFQEWIERDGTTGFAVAGPAEAGPQGTCRALAVLTRHADGSDNVASSRECHVAGRD